MQCVEALRIVWHQQARVDDAFLILNLVKKIEEDLREARERSGSSGLSGSRISERAPLVEEGRRR